MADYDVESHTHTFRKKKVPYTPRLTRYEEAFFSLENQEEKARASRFTRLIIQATTRTVLPKGAHVLAADKYLLCCLLRQDTTSCTRYKIC